MTRRPRDAKGRRAALIVAAAALAVLAGMAILSEVSQRVVLEGSGSSMTGVAGVDDEVSGSIGSITNDSPWGVTLVGAGTADGAFTSDVRVGISRGEPGSASTAVVEWFTEGDAVALASGETGYLWYLGLPTRTDPAGFPTLGIRYLDALGLGHSVSAEIGLLISPPGLPEDVASYDGAIDGYANGLFMTALGEALATADPALVAPFLGGEATEKDAAAFIRSQRGVDEAWGYISNATGPHSAEVSFFRTDSATDSTATFIVSWARNRWSAGVP